MIHGQEKNITTYNLARMNMLLHRVWGQRVRDLTTATPDQRLGSAQRDEPGPRSSNAMPSSPIHPSVIAGSPPRRWARLPLLATASRPSRRLTSALLHGFHFLGDEGTMAIIFAPWRAVPGRGESRIRTAAWMAHRHRGSAYRPICSSPPAFRCILVLKSEKPDDVFFINAAEHYEKGKRQNQLRPSTWTKSSTPTNTARKKSAPAGSRWRRSRTTTTT